MYAPRHYRQRAGQCWASRCTGSESPQCTRYIGTARLQCAQRKVGGGKDGLGEYIERIVSKDYCNRCVKEGPELDKKRLEDGSHPTYLAKLLVKALNHFP